MRHPATIMNADNLHTSPHLLSLSSDSTHNNPDRSTAPFAWALVDLATIQHKLLDSQGMLNQLLDSTCNIIPMVHHLDMSWLTPSLQSAQWLFSRGFPLHLLQMTTPASTQQHTQLNHHSNNRFTVMAHANISIFHGGNRQWHKSFASLWPLLPQPAKWLSSRVW